MPEAEVFDGRSFLPQLRGEAGDPRESIFVHYDKDVDGGPQPVRFARTKRFKLYSDGRFFDVPNDWEEQAPLKSLTPEEEAIRSMLQRVLDSSGTVDPPEPCSGDGLYNPTPTAIEIGAVPIAVESTTADYFVLYVRHDVDGTEVKIPVLVKKGAAGTTTLAENVQALSAGSLPGGEVPHRRPSGRRWRLYRRHN